MPTGKARVSGAQLAKKAKRITTGDQNYWNKIDKALDKSFDTITPTQHKKTKWHPPMARPFKRA